MSISENIYRMPLNYSQSIPNNNGSNKYGTNIELKNYLKNTKTFKNSSNNKAFSIKKIIIILIIIMDYMNTMKKQIICMIILK